MNIYFLVEGKTEKKVYPKWLSYIMPRLKRVNSPLDVQENNYFLISGGGYPSILDNHLADSVSDVNAVGKYDYLVLVIDTDHVSAAGKIDEVNNFMKTNNIQTINCQLVIIPQVVCMETWFLGNRRIYARNPSTPDVLIYSKHYNISNFDPELMDKHSDFTGTIGDFHFQYLKSMLSEKNIRYSKSNPQGVSEQYYVEELKDRLKSDQNCLQSMRKFFDFIEKIDNKNKRDQRT